MLRRLCSFLQSIPCGYVFLCGRKWCPWSAAIRFLSLETLSCRKNFPAQKNGYIDKDISVQNHNRYIPTLALSTSGYGSKPISVSSQPAPGQLPFQISVLYFFILIQSFFSVQPFLSGICAPGNKNGIYMPYKNFTHFSKRDALYFTPLYYNTSRTEGNTSMGDERDMRKLWQLTKNNCKKKQSAYRTFIFLSTFFWTVPPFFVVLAGCVLLHMSMSEAFSAALTAAGITGVGIGFFGSLLYLMRTE